MEQDKLELVKRNDAAGGVCAFIAFVILAAMGALLVVGIGHLFF